MTVYVDVEFDLLPTYSINYIVEPAHYKSKLKLLEYETIETP